MSPTPLSVGPDHSEFACFRKQQRTPKSTGKIAGDATLWPERAGGVPDDPSTAWGIELEGGILPSDSSSLACGTTVVIDTGRIWNHPEKTEQLPQTTVDYCGRPGFLAARNPDECSSSSPRVVSRFFPKCVPGFGPHEDRSTRRTPTFDWEDLPSRGPEVPTLDDYPDHPCSDVGCGANSNQETDSYLGDRCRTYLSPLAGTCIRVY